MVIMVPRMQQNDEALRLLAQMYARWCRQASARSVVQAYERIREILYRATSQQEAYEYLTQAVSDAEDDDRQAYEQARESVAQVIQAGGSAETLMVGETDGYRHLCLSCRQQELNFQRVPFFQRQERRLLLRPEVGGERRSAFSHCHVCLQPIDPTTLVLFLLAGAKKHPRTCRCGGCNRAGTAFLLTIYACDEETQQILFPSLQQVAAPSKRQGVEQAVKRCWEKGWYMCNKDSVLP